MNIVGIVLVCIGVVLSFIGGIWFLVAAFRESVLWGLGCLLFSPVSLIFLILHFGEAAKPVGYSLLGTVLMVVGMMLIPDSDWTTPSLML